MPRQHARLIKSASLVAQTVKNPPAVRETWVRSLGWEDPLEEEGTETYSSILAGKPQGQRSLMGYAKSRKQLSE